MALHGLQGYQGDSEISDSDSEVSPEHGSAPVPDSVISDIGLGIPRSKPTRPSPPPFTKPVVRSAPSITLVNYDRDEDDDPMDISLMDDPTPGLVESKVVVMAKPAIQQGSVSPISMPQSLQSSSLSSSDDDGDEPLFLPLDNVQLPPAPEGVCSQALQNKLISLLETKRRLGITPFDQIKTGKSFRNPSIYEKLIQLCGLNEFGTNYSKSIYDPDEWTEEDYYDKLSEAQKKADKLKQRARAERSKIEFKSGTTTKLPAQSTGGVLPNPSQADMQKRKTKWDVSQQGGSGSSTSGSKSTGSSPVKRNNLPVGAQALINARVVSKSDMMKLIKK